MLTRLNGNTPAADEGHSNLKCSCGRRSELKNPAANIDSVAPPVKYFDETVLIGCSRCTTTAIDLTNYQQRTRRGRWSRSGRPATSIEQCRNVWRARDY